MTEHDIELAKQIDKWCELHQIPPCDHKLVRLVWCEALRAEKQGEANPVACMFINYDGECEEIGHLDNYNGQVPDEFTPLFTYQPDQSAEIARLRNALATLIRVKIYKDKHGKDDVYEVMRTNAWNGAKQALENT